ncbi:TRAP transporter substrate-binding protein [Falsiroseomonas oryzae]|uniref:TRAP transporter substrate-binding protein n=1 Tax=Falsiroseomonas oryzae TaxID=2766473 RepID=UPI0022EAA502|nr:TRAP transporter substrate-binding protein [Roseomonas sp. MO-31]
MFATRRTALIGSLGLLTAPAISHAQQARTLRLNHTDTEVGARQEAANLFARRVQELTDGRFRVQVFHSGQLANDARSLEQVAVGSIDLAITGVVTYATHTRPLNLIALPYLAETYEQGWRLYDNSRFIAEQKQALIGRGMRIVGDWEAGFRSFSTTFALPSPAAARGRKLRIAPVDMIRWIMESQGWNPVVMPVTEVYLAIQQGTVDGQENPVDTIFSQRFFEVAKHITLSNHVYSPLWLCVAERTWGSLPQNARDALMQAGRESGQHNRRQVAANDEALLQQMTQRGATVNKPDLGPWRQASQGAIARARQEYGQEQVDRFLEEASALRARA